MARDDDDDDRDDEDEDDDDEEVESKKPAAKPAAKSVTKPAAKPIVKAKAAPPVDENTALLREIRDMLNDMQSRMLIMPLVAIVLLAAIAIFSALKL